MLSLIKDIGITVLIIVLNHWVYGIEDAIAYDFVVGFIAINKTTFLTTGIIGSGVLLICTAIEGLGLYKITYALSKLFIRLSQFFITFLSLLNIVFYLVVSTNLMRDGGYVSIIVLALILGSSCWALRIIDFNYATRNTIMPVFVLAAMSVALVEFIWPMTGL